MRHHAEATIEGDHFALRMTYNPPLIELIKEIVPSWARRYDPPTKIWRIERGYLSHVVALLKKQLGADDVDLIGKPAPSKPPPPATWAVALFDRLPQHLREPAYTALIKVLHPDVGGDDRMAQELNDSYRPQETRRRHA